MAREMSEATALARAPAFVGCRLPLSAPSCQYYRVVIRIPTPELLGRQGAPTPDSNPRRRSLGPRDTNFSTSAQAVHIHLDFRHRVDRCGTGAAPACLCRQETAILASHHGVQLLSWQFPCHLPCLALLHRVRSLLSSYASPRL